MMNLVWAFAVVAIIIAIILTLRHKKDQMVVVYGQSFATLPHAPMSTVRLGPSEGQASFDAEAQHAAPIIAARAQYGGSFETL